MSKTGGRPLRRDTAAIVLLATGLAQAQGLPGEGQRPAHGLANPKANATVFYGGSDGFRGAGATDGFGLRTSASVDLGDRLVASHIFNVQAGDTLAESWQRSYGNVASVRMKSPLDPLGHHDNGLQVGYSAFKKPLEMFPANLQAMKSGKHGPERANVEYMVSYFQPLMPGQRDRPFLIPQLKANLGPVSVREFVNIGLREHAAGGRKRTAFNELETQVLLKRTKHGRICIGGQWDRTPAGQDYVKAGVTYSR